MHKYLIATAIALAILIVFGMLLTLIFISANNQVYVGNFPTNKSLVATNEFVGTAISQTATAKAFTVTPTPSPSHREGF